MLNDRLFTAAATALQPGGTLTIVVDNAWYAELLLLAVARHGSFQPISGVRAEGRKMVKGHSGFELISAAPGTWCRHEAKASSYFDRLWKTGLSSHSATYTRFVLHVKVAAEKSRAKKA